jgi:putative transposase
MLRKEKFLPGIIFHVYNKSIAGYKIFYYSDNITRFLQILHYYNVSQVNKRFSYFIRTKSLNKLNLLYPKKDSIIKFLSYCIMPDHYHFLIKIQKNDCFSQYINNVENSYSRFFNIKCNRKGPLWQSTFKAVEVKTQEQLLHTTRYIHLNPTTSKLVINPKDWKCSSYKDYINDKNILSKIITEIAIKNPNFYKKFVLDRKDYQQKLKKIKKLLLE